MKKDTKLLNVEIPNELHKRLRFRAVEEDSTIRAIVERALRRELEEPSRGEEGEEDKKSG